MRWMSIQELYRLIKLLCEKNHWDKNRFFEFAMFPSSQRVDGVQRGTGVFYQAMPAVGADGKNILRLIPVQMVTRQLVTTPMREQEYHTKPPEASSPVKVFSRCPPLGGKAVSTSSAPEPTVWNQRSPMTMKSPAPLRRPTQVQGPSSPSVVSTAHVGSVRANNVPPCGAELRMMSGGSRPLLKLIPKVSRRPNSPMKWVIEEEEEEDVEPPVTAPRVPPVSHTHFTKSPNELGNASVMCKGKVFYAAKKGRENVTASVVNTQSGNAPSTPRQHADEVIDLCNDDVLDESSSRRTAAVNPPPEEEEEDHVIFVSYTPPKADSAQQDPDTDTRGSDRSTLAGGGRSSAEGGGGEHGGGSLGTANNVTFVCGDDDSSQPVEPSGKEESDDVHGSAPETEAHTHAAENSTNPRSPSLAPQHCDLSDHLLKLMFGITADVKICLHRVEDTSAGEEQGRTGSVIPGGSGFRGKDLWTRPRGPPALERSEEPVTATLQSNTGADSCSLFEGSSRAPNTLEHERTSGPHSQTRCDESNPVPNYMEPVDELPSRGEKTSPSSQLSSVCPTTQSCWNGNKNTRTAGRTRKRRMCPCCVSGTLGHARVEEADPKRMRTVKKMSEQRQKCAKKNPKRWGRLWREQQKSGKWRRQK